MNPIETYAISLTSREEIQLYAINMPRHADVSPHLPNHSLGIDQKRRPNDAHESLSVELLLLPDTERMADRSVFIGAQPDLELVLGGECLVIGEAVAGYPKDSSAFPREFRQRLAERDRFLGAGLGIVLRIEEQDQEFAFVVRKTRPTSLAGRQFECWGPVAGLKRLCHNQSVMLWLGRVSVVYRLSAHLEKSRSSGSWKQGAML